MVDVDTFLTTLYVVVDDCCKSLCRARPECARKGTAGRAAPQAHGPRPGHAWRPVGKPGRDVQGRLCRKFCSGGHEGAGTPVGGGD